MKRIVIDTNVLVSFLTDRNAEQQARASGLLDAAVAGEVEIILHQVVISEMVYVLSNLYELDSHEIAQIIDDLLSTAGVKPVDEVVWSSVLACWPGRFADFGDGVLAAVASENRYEAVATFDRKFIRRLRKEGIVSFWRA